jgi:hypothetical protein
MNESPSASGSNQPPRDRLAASAAQLNRVATLIAWGFPALGLLSGLSTIVDQLDPSDVGLPGVISALLRTVCQISAYSLAGLVLAALVRALAEWLVVAPQRHFEQAERHAAVPRPALPALEQLRDQALAEFRHEVRERRWTEAAAVLEAFGQDHEGDPRIESMRGELAAARQAAGVDLTAKLDAARQVNDADRVLELHQALVPLLEFDARQALDSDLAKWFLRLIHNRLRSGIIQVDVATLAGRVAEEFAHTTEGASLRASLPTLRRSAGLCPRCAQPYTGIADACPDCLKPAKVEVNAPAV